MMLFTCGVFLLLWAFRDDLLFLLTNPLNEIIKDTNSSIIFLSLTDKFFLHLKTVFTCSLILSTPFWLYQIWKFIVPALYPTERRYSSAFLLSSIVLFALGIYISYYLVVPVAFEFLINYSQNHSSLIFESGISPLMQIDWRKHIALTLNLFLVFGIIFELPLVMIFLTMIGFLDSSFYKKYRKYMIVLSMIIAAILTPPDPITMIILSIPMILLYELGIIGSYFVSRVNNRKELEVNTQ